MLVGDKLIGLAHSKADMSHVWVHRCANARQRVVLQTECFAMCKQAGGRDAAR